MSLVFILIAAAALLALTLSPAAEGLDPDFYTLFCALFMAYAGFRAGQATGKSKESRGDS